MGTHGDMKNSFKNVSTWASWGDTSQVVKQLTPKHPNPFWHPQEASNIHRLAGQTGVGTCQSRILLLSPVSDISLFFARTTWLILSSTSLPGILHVAKLHFCLCLGLLGLLSATGLLWEWNLSTSQRHVVSREPRSQVRNSRPALQSPWLFCQDPSLAGIFLTSPEMLGIPPGTSSSKVRQS